jgi:hypothetical protein
VLSVTHWHPKFPQILICERIKNVSSNVLGIEFTSVCDTNSRVSKHTAHPSSDSFGIGIVGGHGACGKDIMRIDQITNQQSNKQTSKQTDKQISNKQQTSNFGRNWGTDVSNQWFFDSKSKQAKIKTQTRHEWSDSGLNGWLVLFWFENTSPVSLSETI